MKKLIVLLSIALMTVGLGCAALSSYVTPAEVDQDAVWYAVDAGVARQSDYNKSWFPNMADAARLKKDVDDSHAVNQQEIIHLMDRDNLVYGIHKDVVASNLMVAQQREEMLFGETGLLSLGLSMAGMGGFAGLLGLMRKRPQDWTPAEVEATIAETTGRTTAELSAKEKQFVQLVKGVQAFIEGGGSQSDGGVTCLKATMDKYQDTDTRAAVAVVKAS
jgi:hypothetical protein